MLRTAQGCRRGSEGPGLPSRQWARLAGLGALPAGLQLLELRFPHSAGTGPLSTGCKWLLGSKPLGFYAFPAARASSVTGLSESRIRAASVRGEVWVFGWLYGIRGSKRHVLCPLRPTLELARLLWSSANPDAARPEQGWSRAGGCVPWLRGPSSCLLCSRHTCLGETVPDALFIEKRVSR